MKNSSSKCWKLCLWIAIAIHFSTIFFLGLSRHWGYMTSINDLGVFDQAVWGMLNGDSFLNTSVLNEPINWLGFHFHLVLFLFAPLYAIIPNVLWFTLGQAFALSISAWAIFLLASRVCQSEKAGLIWSLVYLVNPFLLNAAAWDFHPITLAVPFVATAMLAIETKDSRLLFLSSLAILFCKEHLGLMVIGFGVVWWLRNKRWKLAIGLISLGIAHSVLVIGIIMPAFSPTDKHVMFGEGLGHLSRYSWLGQSMNEILWKIITEPLSMIEVVVVDLGGIKYILLLLMFVCGFPLLAPTFLLPALGDLAVNSLSANFMPRSTFAYHNASIVPVLIVAAIYGVQRLSFWTNKLSLTQLAGFAAIASFIGGYCLAPLPLPGARNFWAPTHFLNGPDPNIMEIRSALKDKDSISAQANIGAHFSQRKEIYRYPNKVGDVDAIVLRLESPTNNINNFPDHSIDRRKYMFDMLDSHLQMDRTEYVASIACLLSSKEYGILIWNDPWLVFGRDMANHGSLQAIEQKLNRLRKEWQIQTRE